jgi:hypothetical protein
MDDSKIGEDDGVRVDFRTISICNRSEAFVCCSDRLQQKLRVFFLLLLHL